MKKRIVSLVLLVIMALPILAVHTAADPIGSIEENANVTTVSNYNKLHFYFDNEEHATIDSKAELTSAMSALATRTAEYEIYNAQNSDDFNDDLHITVEFTSDFTSTDAYLAFAEEAQNLTTSEEVLDFRQRLNAFSLKYHTALVNKNLDYLSVFGDTTVQTSTYSPFVTLIIEPDDLTEQSLTALCSTNDVANISLSYELVAESEASWNECMNVTNAANIVNNSTYTGEGVRIGVYEADGVCDTSHTNLVNKSITKRGLLPPVDDHATEVTSVIALIAPDADFYAIGGSVLSISSDLDWFIEQNCDVINCSFGYYNNTLTFKNWKWVYTDGDKQYRYDIDGIYDYYIKAHNIVICVSSGNLSVDETTSQYNPNNKITSPGYAYNAVTVGGVTNEGLPYWKQCNYASYVSSSPQSKPNISAPYYVNIPNIGNCQGTSYASPIVAGCIALLEEANPTCKAQPHRVMSILTANAIKTYNYAATQDMTNGNFDKYVGAGIVNLSGMIGNTTTISKVNYDTSMGSVIINTSINLSEGDELQVALSWWITALQTSNNNYTPLVTNYDLRIYGPSSIAEVSTFTDSNVELIRYTATDSGTYRIVVVQSSNFNASIDYDYMAVSYCIN